MPHSTQSTMTMKRSLLVLALTASATLVAATAQAQLQHSPLGPPDVATENRDRLHQGHRPGRPLTPGDDSPGKPVPEPSTMALASMGLVALGGLYRKIKRQ